MISAFDCDRINVRIRITGGALLVGFVAFAAPVRGEVQGFPPSFRVEEVRTDGATIHARIGGTGPAVVLLHGFGDTGDMWAPVAAALVKDHTVLVPDLRGMGLSSHPEGGYDKKTQARDVAQVMDKLGIDKAALVTHDIGNMVGYALAAQFPARVTRWVVIDAPLPGIGPWDEILRSPALWHFNFRGPDVERLVQGRERIYLDRFWNELSADPKAIDEATRRHYAELYARSGAMHSAFNQFAAFTQDAADNKALAAQGKLTMPVLALGGEKSYGANMATELKFVATNVSGGVILNSGHWVMEENPDATTKLILDFLAK
jgi:pimeloyl-ACP methyl ester carboxylesterase